MTFVLDQTFGGADNATSTNIRQFFGANSLISASGTRCRLTFNFWPSSPDIPVAYTSVYFGQGGVTAPNFTGDQVHVLFGGGSSVHAPAGGGDVVSDIFTLPQSWDVTHSYVCAFYCSANMTGNAGFGTATALAGVNAYELASGTDESANTTPSAMGSVGGVELSLRRIEITTAPVSNLVLGGNRGFTRIQL